MGIPFLWFLAIYFMVMAGIWLEIIPDKIMGGFAICITLGAALRWIGDRIPIINNYGAGAIFAVLLPAVMVQYGLLPQYVTTVCKNFFSGYDLSSFIVSSLLVGGVLAMDRKLLIHTGARFIVPMIGSILLVPIIVGGIGAAVGYGFAESMLYISGPILGAGISALVPLSEIYAKNGLGTPDQYLTILTAAVMVANVFSILLASILTSIGTRNPNLFKGFSGHKEGDILRIQINGYVKNTQTKLPSPPTEENGYSELGAGFCFTIGFYVFGLVCNTFLPFLDAYLFMSLLAILLKISNCLPISLCKAADSWTRFVSKTFSYCAMVAISLSSPNLLSVFSSTQFVLLCVIAVLVTILISGGLTWLFGFYFVEGSIMAGLGLTDMGGAGDIAVLGAARRMELLPFLTISTRIGGSINLIWMSFIASLFL